VGVRVLVGVMVRVGVLVGVIVGVTVGVGEGALMVFSQTQPVSADTTYS
jgi:hypothetical protein